MCYNACMSWTFTKEGIRCQKHLINRNWNCLFLMLHNWCYYRGFSMDSLQWSNLFPDFAEDFDKNKLFEYDKNIPISALYKWFIDFLKTYDELILNDLDIANIKKTCNCLIKEGK